MLVLGSSSEARKELLASLGIVPTKVIVPNIDEAVLPKELPLAYVKRMAFEKAKSIEISSNYHLITADTIVTAGRSILQKTEDERIARMYLKKLSGRRHKVYTSFCIKHKEFINSYTVKTTLKMRTLDTHEVEKYILSGEWRGKAGAYGIQGKASAFFPFVSGCFSNVIGLPLPKLISVLKGMKVDINK